MSKTVKLSEGLVRDAVVSGKAQYRSASKQIEYWARTGKIAEESPELPFVFIKDILTGIEESKAGGVSEYKFG